MPPRARASLWARLAGGLAEPGLFPAAPGEWQQLEVPLERVARTGHAILADDRDQGKAWSIPLAPLAGYLRGAVDADGDGWHRRPDLTAEQAALWVEARAVLGLPPWLRRVGPRTPVARPPHIFANVKSKCFCDNGRHQCQKANHSCMRRIVDCSRAPHARGWRAVARAGRAVLRRVGGSAELESLADARPRLDRMLGQLTRSSPECLACGAPPAAPQRHHS